MSRSLRFLAAYTIAAMFTTYSFSQITISGNVRNAGSQEAVQAVSITIKGSSEGTYSDDKGSFSITTNAQPPVVVVFSSVGFETKEVSVSSTTNNLVVDLTSVSALGQEVIIAANRSAQRILDAPVTIERLNSAAIRNAAVPSYYEGLANLKGVDMHTASLTFRTITTRGFVASGNNRFNQLIDGMDNQAPGLNFSVGNIIGLTEPDVDNIELLSGASSALYGSGGMNGTLLITSKNPFKYQGLSYNIKQGIMHTDNRQHDLAPFFNWSMRWAKAIKNKIAFKLTWELLKAQDWEAQDYSNASRTGVLTKVIPGTRQSDPNYDGVNVYGDETNAALGFRTLALGIQDQFRAGVASATGGLIPDIVAVLNQIIPTGASIADITSILNNPAYMIPSALIPSIQQALPIYWGLRNNWYADNVYVSRTGYHEEDLVDYGTLNFKFTGGIHYKITPGIELSWNSYMGTGTTVYTGADRYSLRNFRMGQHKIEIRHKNWFVRGYTTQENAGEAYQATALGRLMQEAFSPSQAVWYPTYIQNYIGYKWNVYQFTNNQNPTDIDAHNFARSVADAGRPLPGSSEFEQLKDQIKRTPIGQGGAKFLDKSDLWSTEGQLNLSDALDFSDQIEIITGVQWKQWVMNSSGTIFADSAGPIKVNETGAYLHLKKKFFDEALAVTAAIRYDKQTNFDGRWTPRVTAVYRVAEDNNIRVSFQTAYRFPTNQDQYIDLSTGSVTLIGCLPSFKDRYQLGTNTWTAESVTAARMAQNPGLLQAATFESVKPENVSAFEIGYKGLFAKKFLLDAYFYTSSYEDFFARVAVVKAASAMNVMNPFTSSNYAYIQNSPERVRAYGWGFGIDWQLPRDFMLGGNIFSDRLNDVPAGFISFFNAPKLRWNLSLRNDNVCKHFGFNVIAKWQDKNNYEGTFISGTLPAFTWVDAQVNYRPPGTKGMIKLGGTNIFNSYRRTGYGSPYVGGIYYVSYGYNLF